MDHQYNLLGNRRYVYIELRGFLESKVLRFKFNFKFRDCVRDYYRFSLIFVDHRAMK